MDSPSMYGGSPCDHFNDGKSLSDESVSLESRKGTIRIDANHGNFPLPRQMIKIVKNKNLQHLDIRSPKADRRTGHLPIIHSNLDDLDIWILNVDSEKRDFFTEENLPEELTDECTECLESKMATHQLDFHSSKLASKH